MGAMPGSLTPSESLLHSHASLATFPGPLSLTVLSQARQPAFPCSLVLTVTVRGAGVDKLVLRPWWRPLTIDTSSGHSPPCVPGL